MELFFFQVALVGSDTAVEKSHCHFHGISMQAVVKGFFLLGGTQEQPEKQSALLLLLPHQLTGERKRVNYIHMALTPSTRTYILSAQTSHMTQHNYRAPQGVEHLAQLHGNFTKVHSFFLIKFLLIISEFYIINPDHTHFPVFPCLPPNLCDLPPHKKKEKRKYRNPICVSHILT